MNYSGKLTLRNDFHNTEATVIVKDGVISAGSLKRAEKKLCGMKDCCCGGIRGRQYTKDGTLIIVEREYDYYGEYARIFEA